MGVKGIVATVLLLAVGYGGCQVYRTKRMVDNHKIAFVRSTNPFSKAACLEDSSKLTEPQKKTRSHTLTTLGNLYGGDYETADRIMQKAFDAAHRRGAEHDANQNEAAQKQAKADFVSDVAKAALFTDPLSPLKVSDAVRDVLTAMKVCPLVQKSSSRSTVEGGGSTPFRTPVHRSHRSHSRSRSSSRPAVGEGMPSD